MRFLLFLLFCLALVSSERKYESRRGKSWSGRNKNTDPCKDEFGVTGPCLALFTKWGFNSTSGKCEEFTYGGCQGNGNKFDTEKECRNRCEVRGDAKT
nr:platelet inhibitor 1 [Necator americanus]